MLSTEEKIEIMQAFVNGKIIQCKSTSLEWSDIPDPSWGWSYYDYRVKPEPKVIYALFRVKNNSYYCGVLTESEAKELVEAEPNFLYCRKMVEELAT